MYNTNFRWISSIFTRALQQWEVGFTELPIPHTRILELRKYNVRWYDRSLEIRNAVHICVAECAKSNKMAHSRKHEFRRLWRPTTDITNANTDTADFVMASDIHTRTVAANLAKSLTYPKKTKRQQYIFNKYKLFNWIKFILLFDTMYNSI